MSVTRLADWDGISRDRYLAVYKHQDTRACIWKPCLLSLCSLSPTFISQHARRQADRFLLGRLLLSLLVMHSTSVSTSTYTIFSDDIRHSCLIPLSGARQPVQVNCPVSKPEALKNRHISQPHAKREHGTTRHQRVDARAHSIPHPNRPMACTTRIWRGCTRAACSLGNGIRALRRRAVITSKFQSHAPSPVAGCINPDSFSAFFLCNRPSLSFFFPCPVVVHCRAVATDGKALLVLPDTR
ncbi:hypothetical protein GE09DRAFT_237052 [Coniochaeta sp. 2T2.1]|nr:hypothetical protein GE09DRAFT_237052 [Coniochaeta sp. 2T2.1]